MAGKLIDQRDSSLMVLEYPCTGQVFVCSGIPERPSLSALSLFSFRALPVSSQFVSEITVRPVGKITVFPIRKIPVCPVQIKGFSLRSQVCADFVLSRFVFCIHACTICLSLSCSPPPHLTQTTFLHVHYEGVNINLGNLLVVMLCTLSACFFLYLFLFFLFDFALPKKKKDYKFRYDKPS